MMQQCPRHKWGVLVVGLISLCGTMSWAEQAGYDARFEQAEDRQTVELSGRHQLRGDQGHVLLRGSGGVLARQASGPGTYYIRFALQEPDRFQYHRAYIGLFVADPADPQSDGYYLQWEPSGLITFSQMIDGQRTRLNQFIHGGPANPNRYQADQVVELTLHVPEQGDGVWLWCHAAERSGDPTTGFKLTEDLPRHGHFGAYNAKWFSHLLVYQMSYRPLEK